MVEWHDQSWHRGTTVVKTGRGERTVTHLQRLSLPAVHYYFNRRLSDQEVVGIVSGRCYAGNAALLGCADAAAFDLGAGCSGFLYAQSVAKQFVINVPG